MEKFHDRLSDSDILKSFYFDDNGDRVATNDTVQIANLCWAKLESLFGDQKF